MRHSLLLKVCGMRDNVNMLEVASCKPDFMGFIFYAASPRYVGTDFVVSSDFPESVKRVGVFVNQQTDAIIIHCSKHQLDFVQLHGHESVDQVEKLKSMGYRVIKVFSIDDNFDFNSVKPFESLVDFFLFDTKGKFYGGNAQRFNWKLLDKYTGKTPFFLSGGIKPELVEEIRLLNHSMLAGIDVNSGVEISPGVKDVGQVFTIDKNLKSKI